MTVASFFDHDFPWETLTAVIGGRSAIDVPKIHVLSQANAEEFLECYGFLWNQPHHRREVESVRSEAQRFIKETLLKDERSLAFPNDLAEQDDIRRILIWASADRTQPLQRWSCALLRVMHTLAHADTYFNRHFGKEIRAQVLSRYQAHIEETPEGMRLGRGEHSIPLLRFEIKHQKSTRSMLVKLLHKPENVATDIFDHLGVRFVTQNRFDALRVIRYLRTCNVLMFANVKPSRSRNSLIDMEWLRGEIDQIREDLPDSHKERVAKLSRAVQSRSLPLDHAGFDRHSSVNYHAIQFTCRQLIRVPNPFVDAEAWPPPLPGLESLQPIDQGGPELLFFFPYEVQVLDAEAYEMSRSGLAAHTIYKQRQLQTVKHRVLGPLIEI